MLGKSRIVGFFQWFVVPEGRKVGSLKRRARSDKRENCPPLWRETHFQIKMRQNTTGSDHFSKLGCNQNVQNTACSDHFLKLGYRKIARRCGAQHIFESKCKRHRMDPFLKFRCRKIIRRCGANTFSSQNGKK